MYLTVIHDDKIILRIYKRKNSLSPNKFPIFLPLSKKLTK